MVLLVLLICTASLATFAVMWVADHGRPLAGAIWFGLFAVIDAAVSAWELAAGDWAGGAWMALMAAVNAWSAWRYWNRRKRKRAAALAGAKSRARVAALARKVREAGTPRKVLRPVPGRSL